MLIAAQTPRADDPLDSPQLWACPKFCFDSRTFAEQFADAGLSWRSYNRTRFGSPFHMIRHLKDSPYVVTWQQLQQDARHGNLPHLAYVVSEARESEHPPQEICRGQAWTLHQLQAIAQGPQWGQTAVFVTWDDWGGFYDHVSPPVVEQDRRGRPLRLGYRVPCLIVSPFARRGYLSRQTHSHLSILRFASDNFGLPPLNERVAATAGPRRLPASCR